MTLQPAIHLAFGGASIDGSLFTTVTDFARDTKWLNTPLSLWTNAGLGVFAVLMLIGFWNARRRDDRTMTLALAAPVAVAVAFAFAEVVKKLVAEVRPCYSLPHDYFVEACPVRTDYAFPSGHSTTAFATVAAVWLIDRRLSAITAAFAVFEGFTRVYVGAHYPHDVIGAALFALPAAYLTSLVLGQIAVPLVRSLRAGALEPLLTAAHAGIHTRAHAGAHVGR